MNWKLSILILPLAAATVFGAQKHGQRLEDATTVVEEIMGTADKAIPQGLFAKAECVVVVPGLKKGAFLFGAKYGKGYVSCRNGNKWSAPATVRVEGGSFGFQAGITEVDLVMLVMNRSGADRLMTSRFTIGGTAQVAAGPVGRSATAETDALMRAEILSYSRSRGVFAGVALQGATLREDKDANRALYHQTLTTRDIVRDGKVKATPSGEKFIQTLAHYGS